MYVRLFKPFIDIICALIGITVLSPLMVLTAVAILVEDGRPVFFIHERVGKDGQGFKILKFRSMGRLTALVPSTEATEQQITKVGSVIRRLNIDELPQLFNVLRRDMSIVGPRPGLPSQEKLHYLRGLNGALALRPGITGLAQINSYNGMSLDVKAALDGKYARRVSLWVDLKIVFLTLRYLLTPPPIY